MTLHTLEQGHSPARPARSRLGILLSAHAVFVREKRGMICEFRKQTLVRAIRRAWSGISPPAHSA